MYKQIDSNKQKTWALFLVFIVFISVIGYFLSTYYQSYDFLFLAIIISIAISLISYYFGDQVALLSTGARLIKKEDNPYVYNLVENLCLTAGLPVPKIYLISDNFPNAFATGRNPKNASLALTTGLVQSLENEELEGVIAHELSHIKNYDIRLMMAVIVLVGIVTMAADMWWRSGMRRRSENSERGGQLGGVLMMVGLILLILSPIIAKLLQLAISRKREYLADADGALLTRYPDGLARALEKISSYKLPMQRASNATAHLYIANPFGGRAAKGLAHLFSTHPPIEERIRVLREMA
ncbi:MAG TPA: M48 family metallopeptidase [bacterium]|nr:M48 family metallopeptidase [bacterium]HPL95790.1 M48 family metallopeptidase [bacterium]